MHATALSGLTQAWHGLHVLMQPNQRRFDWGVFTPGTQHTVMAAGVPAMSKGSSAAACLPASDSCPPVFGRAPAPQCGCKHDAWVMCCRRRRLPMLARSGTGSRRWRRRRPEQHVQHRSASTPSCGSCSIKYAYSSRSATGHVCLVQASILTIIMPALPLPQQSSTERTAQLTFRLQALHEAEMRQEQVEGDVRSRQAELRRQSDQEKRLKDDMQTLRRSQGWTRLSAALCPCRPSQAP